MRGPSINENEAQDFIYAQYEAILQMAHEEQIHTEELFE